MEGLIPSVRKMPERQSCTCMVPCQLPWTYCWTVFGVMGPTAELSSIAGPVASVYLFARDAKSAGVWVCMR